jgi:hypothetical protein
MQTSVEQGACSLLTVLEVEILISIFKGIEVNDEILDVAKYGKMKDFN